MKDLLAVSWSMPPLVLPRSLQVSRSLSRLSELGWQSTVICVDPRSVRRSIKLDPALEAEYRQRFELVRVSSPEASLFYRFFWRLFPRQGTRPDQKIVWVPRAVRAARALLARRPFDAILTFAQPWSDHLVGLELKKTGAKPWIAHFSDPWIDTPYRQYDPKSEKICRHLESEVIRNADAVVFITRQTAERVMSKYPPEWKRKVHVLPHGYDPLVAPFPPAEHSGRLRLVYTGSFYGNRTPEGLLHALAQLDAAQPIAGQIELLLVGSRTVEYRPLAAQLGLEDVVRFFGPVSFTESQALAASAGVLLVIDAPSQGESLFLPSKLVDYLAFNKPVLGLTPITGASADLLQRLECPVVAPDDVPGIAAALQTLLDQWRSGALATSAGFRRVAQEYDIQQTTLRLEEIILGAMSLPPQTPGRA